MNLDRVVMKMILEGKHFNIFNINVEALRHEGYLIINYPSDGYSENWIVLMERLRDIVKRQGREVPEEEWVPFNLCARKKGFNIPVIEFNFFASLLDGGSYFFKIDSRYSPLALKKPPIIEMVGSAKAFMQMELANRCLQ
jgi:hypothetical protein